MQTIIKMELTPQQVLLLCGENNIIRKVKFVKEDKTIVLVKYLKQFYVLEHDHHNAKYYKHIGSKVISDVVEYYLNLLCLYA